MKAPATQSASEVTPVRRPAKTGPDGYFTKLPNEFYRYLMAEDKLSGVVQIYVLLAIIHHTLGAEGRPEWARLSLAQFARICHTDRIGACRVLADLVKREIIAEQPGKGCKTDIKGYRITPEKWKNAPPYKPPVTAKAIDDAETEEESVSDAAQQRASHGDKLIVRPGRKPACVPARLAPKDRDPVDFQIRYLNTGTEPVEISATNSAAVLTITFSATPKQQAKEKRSGVACVLIANSVSPSDSALSDFTPVISALMLSEFRKPLDPADKGDQKFIQSIVEAAGPDLPASEFETYSSAAIREMRRNRKPVTSGILVYLARKAAGQHAIDAAEALPKQKQTPMSDYEFDEYLESFRLTDPEGYELIKRQSREGDL
jgi:hypothetical protein